MKVLVVDDSTVMRKIVMSALGEGGHTDFVEAEDGKDALDKMDDVDFILTDWNMPGMNGLTFVKEVRKTKSTPILMISTERGQEQVVEALRNGVNDYIVKPFTPRGLLNKVESVLEK
jgi:two-component system chemotaxis response regulator CheY